MNKAEKRTALGLSLAAALLLVFFAYKQVLMVRRAEQQPEYLEAKGGEDSQVHNIGDEFDLAGVEPGYNTYLSSLGWTGTMGVRVDEARAWDEAEDVALEEGLGDYPEDLIKQNCFVELTVTLINKSAQPQGSTGHSDHPEWFNISSIRLFNTHGDQIGALTTFDGTPEDALVGESFYFDLPVGKQSTYKLGFLVEKSAISAPLVLGDCTVHIGTNEMFGSCVVSLEGAGQ